MLGDVMAVQVHRLMGGGAGVRRIVNVLVGGGVVGLRRMAVVAVALQLLVGNDFELCWLRVSDIVLMRARRTIGGWGSLARRQRLGGG